MLNFAYEVKTIMLLLVMSQQASQQTRPTALLERPCLHLYFGILLDSALASMFYAGEMQLGSALLAEF